MPPPDPVSIPDDVRDLFDEPALGHVSYLSDDGGITTFPLWVDYDGTHLLTSSPVGSKKGHAFRARPQVAVSIVSTKTPWHWLSASGRVVEIRPDEGLEFINRMSRKYTGGPYQRPGEREVFVISIDRIRTSGMWRG
jgi:PPOX class probable F420-dependent enzyme